ncbi:MAG TPA: adenylate/guanylate cyclase domain-containing protein [Geminicoccaceae bacterium]|nr:adenylate/guanylate cyclase domain-containing protein [Geminicoccaceae bacterium]
MLRAAGKQGGDRWRLSIAAFQGVVLGGLVFLTLTGLLVLTLYTAYRNTDELLGDKSRLLLHTLTTAVSRYVDAAQAQVDYIAELIEQGTLDPNDQQRLYDILAAGLAATQQVHGVLYIDPRGWAMLATRGPDGSIGRTLETWQAGSPIGAAMAAAAERDEDSAFWGPPVYTEEAGTVLNLRRPVRRDASGGMVVAALTIAQLSEFVGGLESESGQIAFILYDHDWVLAHPALVYDFEGLGPGRPLPRVTEVGDPILFNIWSEGWQQRRLDIGIGHRTAPGQGDYVFLYEPLEKDAEMPWLVGSYFREDEISSQVIRVFQTALIGVAGIAVTMIVAFLLVRTIRTPITELARAATLVQALALDRVATLPRSHLRELDDAMDAFNAMMRGLKAFALYVPRDLIQLLLARGDPADLASESREVTVLFTDIVGFTSLTERLTAADTATFLNRHFALLSRCIEAEGGTIDKYIGDGIMALWNAAEKQPDHAARAVRAARAIRDAVRADNAGREPPVRLRIGVHSGPVVVGNIGSATRMNYTVVGDTVNTANRLESLGRELLPDADVAVLLSEATVAALPPDLPVVSLGRHALRGRDAPTEVFTLAAP